ncbi:YegJ family protein [Chitinilyticum piscinae]|uniref:DUF2314 domain-containing protein n=1 Tax=Chitinilyticum piscinae TaxID=2866724 RepID=A0A8J7FX69_9NEIS|nr:DUF2314 domain-containing protein [Chitinilyticum piscinae]MBE9608300.1 DUF2314 domain-containing protein [Chitinilyticum piscinae]
MPVSSRPCTISLNRIHLAGAIGQALLALTLGLTLGCATANAKSISQRAADDEVTHMSHDDPAMRRAMAKAKATLDDFLLRAAQPASGTHSYALKVAISDGRNTEYFWFGDFTGKGKQFSGILNNEPRLIKGLRSGQTLSFKREQIVDWTYMDDKQHRMFGNFTACALLTREPAEEAAQFQKQYGLQCD